MSLPCRRTRAASVAGGTLLVTAVLTSFLTTSPAFGALDVPDAVLAVGAAAAGGAGDAATGAIAESAYAGMSELGRVAASLDLPAAATPTKAAAVSPAPSWAWDGWRSGASGVEAEDGTFGTWRGKPVQAVSVWADGPEQAQTEMTPVDRYADYVGDMDVAVGGLVRREAGQAPETWKDAAAGKYVARWTTAMRTLRAKRAGKGTTYVRIAHEMNGDWMAWGMNAASLKDYIAGYRLYASIVRKEFPEARLTWSPNGGNHTNVSIDQMYPGNDVVDVVGPDIYDGWPDATTPAIFKQVANTWLTPQSPRGILAWQQWAARHGKPLGLPEWGLTHGDQDAFIVGVHDVLAKYAGQKGRVSNAGRFVYDVYFNAEQQFKLLNGTNPKSSAAYKARIWGN